MIRVVAFILGIDDAQPDGLFDLSLLLIIHFGRCVHKTASAVYIALTHAWAEIRAVILRVFDTTLDKIFYALRLLVL